MNWLGLPPAGYFSRAGKVTKSAPKPRFWNPFPVGKRGICRTILLRSGRRGHRTYNDKRNVSSGGRRGDAHIAPLIEANTPTFRTVCGSGANAEAIPHLRPFAKSSKRVGRTPTILNVRGALRKSRSPDFWRRFLYTFCRCWQKVCRRRHGDTDRPALPAYTAKLPDNARAGTPACCAGVPVSGASKSISRVLS